MVSTLMVSIDLQVENDKRHNALNTNIINNHYERIIYSFQPTFCTFDSLLVNSLPTLRTR